MFSYTSARYSEDVILLVEDEAISRYGFATILRTNGHEVMEAADGQEALKLLEQYNVDLVITDLAMPKVTGFDLVGQIRSKWPHIPILIISAYISQDAERISDGNAEFMYKPIDPPDLIATVRRLLPNLTKA